MNGTSMKYGTMSYRYIFSNGEGCPDIGMENGPILNVGTGPDGDGSVGIVASDGGGEPDGGLGMEDDVAYYGGGGCYPGGG